MRRTFLKSLLASLPLAALGTLGAGRQALAADTVKVVYHFADGTAQATRGLANIRNHLRAEPQAKIVVVALADGIGFLLADARDRNGKPFDAQVAALAAQGVNPASATTPCRRTTCRLRACCRRRRWCRPAWPRSRACRRRKALSICARDARVPHPRKSGVWEYVVKTAILRPISGLMMGVSWDWPAGKGAGGFGRLAASQVAGNAAPERWVTLPLYGSAAGQRGG